jgi:hypothetical protein
MRVAPDLDLLLRPALEAQLRGLVFTASEASDFSFLTLTGRVGAYLGKGQPRLYLGYRPEYLLLNQDDRFDDAPVWYFSAHRGELELEVASWMFAFAGVGQRGFRERGRTRTEADAGLGGHVPLVQRLSLLWALSGRRYAAENEAYDLAGGTAIVNLQYQLPKGWWLRTGFTWARDWYPKSEDYFEPGVDKRTDTYVKVGGLIGSPSLWGLRVGLGYEYSDRDSTAERFAFADHRVTLRITWSGSASLSRPERVCDKTEAPMDWGFEGGEAGTGERIQDLLRQEEQVQRSCGCVQ